MSVEIENPDMPFWNNIPGGMAVGKKIKIRGIFPSTMNPNDFMSINLCENSLDTIPLHLSIRFNHRVVVRNTYQRGNWEREEKDGPFPFSMGRQFIMEILLQSHGYQISVNGQFCWTFAHRLSYSGITHLNMDGRAIIWNVEFVNKKKQVQHHNFPRTQSPAAMFVHNPGMPTGRLAQSPILPYGGYLPQPLSVGSTIKINGFFPAALDPSVASQINLCHNSKENIALHLSIRFNHRVVVRNTLRHSNWETEERGGPFPFAAGREFQIQIVVRSDSYQISVNNSHCWTFAHRLAFGMVNCLKIEGQMSILYIDYVNSKAQKQNICQPPQPQQQKPEPVYNPPVPFSYHMNGGIKPGMMIYISGVPVVNFMRFTINLQCGRDESSVPDVALHIDVRGYSNTVVRNTRRQGRWEDEETAASHFPFFHSVPFDMIIMVHNEKYMIAINGSHFTEYYHRMPRFAQINTLRIENDVRITSVRVGA